MAELPIFNYKVPEKFLGTSKENAIEWIDRFEMICRHNHWTNNDLARAIEVSLKGAAFKMIVDLGREMLTWIIGRTVWFKRPRRMASRRTKGMCLDSIRCFWNSLWQRTWSGRWKENCGWGWKERIRISSNTNATLCKCAVKFSLQGGRHSH